MSINSSNSGAETILLAKHGRGYIWEQSPDCYQGGMDGPWFIAFCDVSKPFTLRRDIARLF